MQVSQIKKKQNNGKEEGKQGKKINKLEKVIMLFFLLNQL